MYLPSWYCEKGTTVQRFPDECALEDPDGGYTALPVKCPNQYPNRRLLESTGGGSVLLPYFLSVDVFFLQTQQ